MMSRVSIGILGALIVASCGGGGGGGSKSAPPVLTLSSPQAGDAFGSTLVVQWMASSSAGTVEIAISADSGATFTTLSEATENDGEFSADTSELVEGDGYLVRITPRSGPRTGEAQRSGAFSLDRTPPVVELLSDFEGMVLNGTPTVEWSTDDESPAQVTILVSSNSGASFEEVVAEGVEDTGSFTLNTNALEAGTGYRVRLVAADAAGNESAAVDSADFEIDHVPALSRALYVDANDDGDLNQGDQLVLDFTARVTLNGVATTDFDLAVTGDTFGTEPSFDVNDDGDLVVSLGANPVLKARGIFSDSLVTANAPSGIDLSALIAENRIENEGTGHDAISDGTLDLNASFEAGEATFGALETSRLTLHDLDGDGDLDVLRGVTNAAAQVWLNDGNGSFSRNGVSLTGAGISALLAADLDLDGDIDVLTAETEGTGKLWQNDGDGRFTDSGQSFDSAMTRAVAYGDFDADGDPDVAFGNENGANTIWTNSGGTFSDSGQLLGSATTRALVALDIDRDGDLDLFAANDGSSHALWLNNGSGTFSESGQTFAARSARAVAVADFDRNGGMDLFVANADRAGDLLRNDGAGTLVAEVATANTLTAVGVAVADLDLDGSLDLALASPTSTDTILWNDGGGLFSTSLDFETGSTTAIAVGDIDADGDADVLRSVASGGFSANKNAASSAWGTMTFVDSGQTLAQRDVYSPGIGDLDGDGDLDALFASPFDNTTVYLNTDGLGTFTFGSNLVADTTFAGVLFDADGDGDLDFGRGNFTNAVTVWLNDGSASFSLHDSLSANSTIGLAAGDFDQDGDQDLFLSNWDNRPNEVWLNDGTGDFSDSGQTLGTESNFTAWPGDLDGDGDIDVLCAGEAGVPNRPYFNDGSGVFTSGTGFSTSDRKWFTPIGDLDGDGDLDVAVPTSSGTLTIWLNDGLGTFVDSGQSLSIAQCTGAALYDVDGDGDLDLFICSSVLGADQLWLNDGQGQFSGPTALPTTGSITVGLGDYDSDGDVDAIFCAGVAAKVVFNR